MTLSEFMKAYREEHGLSQRQFANICGLSNGYIAMLERGLNPSTGEPITPSIVALKKIATGMGTTMNVLFSEVDDIPIDMGEELPGGSNKGAEIPDGAVFIDAAHFRRIPILGYISAGLPLYAEQHIEGYTYTDLDGGAEYFALRVKGDSMNALGINDGYQIIVRRQDEVENGEVAVVLVGEEDATVKRFYTTDTTVTLMPQSTNPVHQPQIYDLSKTDIKILGKVVKVEFSL